ncbi:MAG TPA: hypothetical protein VIW48_03970 [Nitrospiraceae bacterium]
MANTTDNISVADFLGPWVDPDWDSGLIDRCRTAWGKPLRDLTNQEMATLLRQRVAVEHILPLARKRVEGRIDNNTEIYDGERKAAIQYASNAI